MAHPTVKGLAKYEQKGLGRCWDQEVRAAAANNYALGQSRFRAFESQIKEWVHTEMPMPSLPRKRVLDFCQHVYGLRRKCPEGTLLPVIAMEIARTHDDWLTVERALKAVELCLKALSSPLGEAELAGLRSDVERRIAAGTQPGEAEPMKGSETTEGSMSDKQSGEQSTDTGVQSKPKGARRNGRSRRFDLPAGSDVLSTMSVAEVETILDTDRRRIAANNLRLALAGHQPVVKRVVARRLCDHASFDDIAQEHGLTRAEVEDILTRMRAWVARFTAYFNEDYYWKETGEKYIIPEH